MSEILKDEGTMWDNIEKEKLRTFVSNNMNKKAILNNQRQCKSDMKENQ